MVLFVNNMAHRTSMVTTELNTGRYMKKIQHKGNITLKTSMVIAESIMIQETFLLRYEHREKTVLKNPKPFPSAVTATTLHGNVLG